MLRRIMLVTLVMALAAGSTLAQGEFLRPGESGFGASGLKSLTSDVDAYGLSFGTSPGGYFDLCFSYARNEDADVNAYGPSFTYYFKKSLPGSTTGIGLTVGYVHLESEHSSGSADELVIGVSMFANLYASTSVAIQPSLSGSASIGLKEGSGGTTVFTPTAALILAHQRPLRPFIGLSYTVTNETGGNHASVGLGLVIQWEKD